MDRGMGMVWGENGVALSRGEGLLEWEPGG